MNRLHPGAQAAQALGSGTVGSSIGRVDHNAQPRQVASLEARGHGPDVAAAGQVPGGGVWCTNPPVQPRVVSRPCTIAGRGASELGRVRVLSGARRSRATRAVEQLAEPPLYLVLRLIAQLAPSGREQLHAIVVPRIVRRRHHRHSDPLVVTPASHCGRGNDAQVDG